MILGAVEGGGTKFVVAVGSGIEDVHRRTTVPTTTPGETLARVRDFLGDVDAIGVAMFGPLDLTNGRTLRTPKEGWSDQDIVAPLGPRDGIAIDTDVNAAALSEGAPDVVYVTVGTGVGVGVVVDGRPLHGTMHPELGHLLPARLPGDDFAGTCPFHGACVEGLASGPAIRARTGRTPESLDATDPAWLPAVDALGQLVATCVLAYAPSRIVVGGGVMRAPHLIPRIGDRARDRLAGYPFDLPPAYVAAPRRGDDAGLAGAFLLAARAARPRGAT